MDDNEWITNASIFIPDYLNDFPDVSASDIQCVVDEAKIPGPSVVGARVTELKAAVSRCGLSDISYRYCVEYPNT